VSDLTCARCSRYTYFSGAYREMGKYLVPVRLMATLGGMQVVVRATFSWEQETSLMSWGLATRLNLDANKLPILATVGRGPAACVTRKAPPLYISVPSSPDVVTEIPDIQIREGIRSDGYLSLGQDALRGRYYLVMMPTSHFCVFRHDQTSEERRRAGRLSGIIPNSTVAGGHPPAAQQSPTQMRQPAAPRSLSFRMNYLGSSPPLLGIDDFSPTGLRLRGSVASGLSIDQTIEVTTQLVTPSSVTDHELVGRIKQIRQVPPQGGWSVHIELDREAKGYEHYQMVLEELSAIAAFSDGERCGNEWR
jgi:hypothetical protein